jgi:hypothetical protein
MKYYSIAKEFRSAIDAHHLHSPSEWMACSVQDIIIDRTSETRRLAPPTPLPTCYAKIYRYPRRNDRIKILLRGGLFGRSRAKVEFDNLQHLHEKGLAPQVIAFGQNRTCGLLSASLLVINEVVGAVPMDTFVAEQLPTLSPLQRKAFIQGLADFTRTMNENRFVNSEYHWRNILITTTDNDFTFQVIDPSSSRRRYKWTRPFFDLATLDVCAPYFFTRSERLRFLKQYHQILLGQPLTAKQKKRVRQISALREIVAKKELKRHSNILPAHVGLS